MTFIHCHIYCRHNQCSWCMQNTHQASYEKVTFEFHFVANWKFNAFWTTREPKMNHQYFLCPNWADLWWNQTYSNIKGNKGLNMITITIWFYWCPSTSCGKFHQHFSISESDYIKAHNQKSAQDNFSCREKSLHVNVLETWHHCHNGMF